ncbi:hypothetical protein [Streptomyces sp. M54]|nr:hypothetical protein [Streptomyces sp. M54]
MASFRGRAGTITRAELDFSQTDNAPTPMQTKGGVHAVAAGR